MWRRGLSRQILLLIVAVTVISAFFVYVGFYAAYALIAKFFPDMPLDDSWLPSVSDLLTLAASILFALSVAGILALKLAQRILAPLNSLAESARRIANGDLTARAIPGDKSLGETALLVDDFNAMAQKLQVMADDVAYWNAAIAHELRTPLTILKGKLQGVADGVFVPTEELIRNLLLQIDGLARLVDDLRVVTLADSGRLDLQIERVALATDVREVASIVESTLKGAGFSLRLTLLDLTVLADPMRIRQALLALLNNVQRYATPGRVEITTLTFDSKAIIRIEDSGPGLPLEFAKRAFDPFTRADASRSRLYGGSGLGLSVVRAIAEAHGGQAACHNSDRGGAVFEISLPLASDHRHVSTALHPISIRTR